MSDTRADVTSMGLFLVSFIMLVFGLVGIYGYTEVGGVEFNTLFGASVEILALVGVFFVLLAIGAWWGGNKFLMVLFGFLGLFTMLYSGLSVFVGDAGLNFIFIIMAIFFIIFALWTFILKAGMLLVVLLIAAAIVFLMYGFVLSAMADGNDPKTFLLILGVFSLIAFAIATYLALADCTDGKLPTF